MSGLPRDLAGARARTVFVTIDDGHPSDLAIADMLEKRGISAIFYVPIENSEGKPVLDQSALRELATRFEIGSHTKTHRDLMTLPFAEAREEIRLGKEMLEQMLGRAITAFAPPRGHYRQEHIEAAYGFGCTSFRSARLLSYGASSRTDRVWHPNLHLYPHTRAVDIAHAVVRARDIATSYARLRDVRLSHLQLGSAILQQNGRVHLWGHGWEISQVGIDLPALLDQLIEHSAGDAPLEQRPKR